MGAQATPFPWGLLCPPGGHVFLTRAPDPMSRDPCIREWNERRRRSRDPCIREWNERRRMSRDPCIREWNERRPRNAYNSNCKHFRRCGKAIGFENLRRPIEMEHF